MRAEKDAKTRYRMMVVLGVLEGHSTKTASDFACVDQRTVLAASATSPAEAGCHGLAAASDSENFVYAALYRNL